MRRPMVGIALVFGGGVWIGLLSPWLQVLPLLMLAGAVWCVALLLHGRCRETAATCCTFLVLVMLGMLLSLRVHHAGSFMPLPVEAGESLRCRVQGVVIRDAIEPASGNPRAPIRFRLQAKRLMTVDTHHKVSVPLEVALFGRPESPPREGEHWELEGKLEKRPAHGRQRSRWRLETGSRLSRRLAPPGQSAFSQALQIRQAASRMLAAGIEPFEEVTGVINAMLLGYRASLPPEVRRTFMLTGTMHIFAISGLHVGILCAILVFVIGMLGVPRTCRVFALAPIIGFYAYTTGSRASAIRAGIMTVAYLLAPTLRRRPDTISALGLAGICILVWQPAQLMEIGFIFSFTAVGGILAMVPVLEGYLRRMLHRDPFLLPEAPDSDAWWKVPLLWVGRLAAVSLAAWLSTAPLALYFFGRFAPIALAANLIVLPLAFLILVTGCLSLAGGAFFGLWLSAIFNSANLVFVRLLNGGMRLLAAVPFGHFQDIHFPRVAVAAWYMVLVAALVWHRHTRQAPDDDIFFAG